LHLPGGRYTIPSNSIPIDVTKGIVILRSFLDREMPLPN
jgi:hypothetical protein